MLAVGAENIYLFESARKHSLHRQMVQEEERRNLSFLLHNEPLQQVTYAINVIDQLLTKHFSSVVNGTDGENGASLNRGVTTRLVFVSDNLRLAADALRKVCVGLYPPFHDQGIKLAVEDVVRYFEKEYGLVIRYRSNLNGVGNSISEEVTAAVSRVLNEALNNVLKHAEGAGTCVSLEVTGDDTLVLSVADDGPGTQVADLSFSELVRRQHLGIVGMHEWAQQVGGDLQILPNKPSGTRILLSCSI